MAHSNSHNNVNSKIMEIKYAKKYNWFYTINITSMWYFLYSGDSLLSKLIRIGETSIGEEDSVINHVGIVTGYGPINIADSIEALVKVKQHTIYSQYHNQKDQVAIFRPNNLTPEQIVEIQRKAISYVGREYGYLKIATHTLDYVTGKHFIFRRLTHSDKYPICSWVVAHAYKAAGLDFGCDPGMADPDDIWDFCIKYPEKYSRILELTNI